MPCGCDTYECVEVGVNPCNTGTMLDIVATQTGLWTAHLYMGVSRKVFGVQVATGVKITIFTDLLNENYVHELRLYNTSGGLVNCYKLKTFLSANDPDSMLPPAVGSLVWEWDSKSVSNATSAVNLGHLESEISPIVWFNQNSIKWDEYGITMDEDTGIMDITAYTNIYGAFTGKITFQYKSTITV